MNFKIGAVLTLFTISQVYTQQPSCKYLEVSVVLDTSGSINFHDETASYKLIKNLSIQIFSKVRISQSAIGNRGSIVQFTKTARITDACDKHDSTQSIIDEIENLKGDTDELTNVEDGLLKSYESLSSNGCGDRFAPKLSRVIILISDGEANVGSQNSIQPLFTLAEKIRNEGISILAVAIGNPNLANLKNITGDPDLVFHPETIDDLMNLNVLNSQSLCFNFPGEATEPQTCSCNVTIEIPAKFSKMEIIRKFEGKCYLDKLEAARLKIEEDMEELLNKTKEIESCKHKTKEFLKTSPSNHAALFDNYEQCNEKLNCTFNHIKLMLEAKLHVIKNKIEIEKMGFGSFKLSGFMDWVTGHSY